MWLVLTGHYLSGFQTEFWVNFWSLVHITLPHLTIVFTNISWVGCQNLPCACPQLCSRFCNLAYKETKEGSPIHCKDNSTIAFLFSACHILFFCLQALSAITICSSLVRVMTCFSLPAFLWRKWLRHLEGNIRTWAEEWSIRAEERYNGVRSMLLIYVASLHVDREQRGRKDHYWQHSKPASRVLIN